MRFALPAALAALLVGVAASPAAAQIVNVQGQLATEAKPGWSGTLAGALDWRTGNVDLLVLGAAPMVRWRCGPQLWLLILRGEFGSAGGTRITAHTFEHLRYRYRFHERILAEAFVQHEYDEFRRLEIRAVTGVGPRFDLVNEKTFQVALGVAYMLEYEEIASDALPDAGDTAFHHRISSYLTGHYDIEDNLQIVETVYAQPVINDPGDIKLLDETSLVVKASDTFSLRTSLTIAYDSEPPDGIEDLDTVVQSSVSFTF